MGLAGISFGGLASGLDTAAIIEALLAVERRPIDLLERQKDDLQEAKKLFGTFEQRLKDVLDAAEAIKTSGSFLEFEASTDNEDKFFVASAGSSAATGTYDIGVRKLAVADAKSSLGRADKDATTYGSGQSLVFTIDGENHVVSLGSGETLDGIAGAINNAEIGIQATVVDTGAASNPYQLVLSSETPGTSGAFTVTTDPIGGSTALDTLVSEISSNSIATASDALLTFNGVEIIRSSNTISDLIPGVTLDLKSATGEDPPTAISEVSRLTITPDSSGTGEKIQELVDKYNGLIDFFEDQGNLDEEGNPSSPIFGDATLRTVRSSLRSTIGASANTSDPAFQLLSQVGIEADQQGRLTFTQSEFDEALTADERAVRDLFAGDDEATSLEGIAVRLFDQIDSFTDFVDGIIKARKDGFDRRIKQADDGIARGEERLERTEFQLTQRFANLEVLLTQLQSQGSALGGIQTPAR